MSAMDLADDEVTWKRTGAKDEDDLHIYLEGLYYDCVISVSNSESGPRCFKCHKYCLARASVVFEKMFFGTFNESTKGRDEVIVIHGSKTSPDAFDLAMRFLYGNKKDFKSCKLAIEVYYFADEWMIDSLIKAATEFLRDMLNPDNVLMVYEMFHSLGVEAELQNCLEIIADDTVDVLSSMHWVTASEETVLSIYKLEKLQASETQLYDFLVEWGKNTGGSNIDINIRARIEKILRCVRFRSMDYETFGAICKRSSILTEDEKIKVFLSLSLSDKNEMPANFAHEAHPRTLAKPVRHNWYTSTRRSCTYNLKTIEPKAEPLYFSFFVDKSGIYLHGFYLFSLNYANKGKSMSVACTLKKACSNHKIASASFNGINVMDGDFDDERVIKLDAPAALEKMVVYTICVHHCSQEPLDSVSFEEYSENQVLTFSKFDLHLAVNHIEDVCALSLSVN